MEAPNILPQPVRRSTAIRLSEAERSRLTAKAARCGQKLSTFMRETALGATPRSVWDEKAFGQLRALGHNLNQLVRLAHMGQLDAGAVEELARVRASLELMTSVLW